MAALDEQKSPITTWRSGLFSIAPATKYRTNGNWSQHRRRSLKAEGLIPAVPRSKGPMGSVRVHATLAHCPVAMNWPCLGRGHYRAINVWMPPIPTSGFELPTPVCVFTHMWIGWLSSLGWCQRAYRITAELRPAKHVEQCGSMPVFKARPRWP